MSEFHLTPGLIDRIDQTEFNYSTDRMQVVRESFGDPASFEFIEKPGLRAVMAARLPNPFFNRMLLGGAVSINNVVEILSRFEGRGVTPSLEISPGSLNTDLAIALSEIGFVQTGFLPIFAASSAHLKPRPPAVETRVVSGAEDLSAFQDLYIQGWEISPGLAPTLKSNIANWFELENWRLFLASVGGLPISCAVLYLNGGLAYLADATTPKEHRGEGAQSALLSARISYAQKSGSEIMFSRADFDSTSQRNMERSGLAVSYMRARWTKLPRLPQ